MKSISGGIAILLAGLVAGCGGGETLTTEQFVAELNAMCDDFGAKEDAIGEPHSLAEVVEKGPLILAAFDAAIGDKIGALKAPAEMADQADHLVELAARRHDLLADLVDAAEVNDLEQVQALAAKNQAQNEEGDSIARDLGVKGCIND